MLITLHKLLLLFQKEKRNHIKNNIHKYIKKICPTIDDNYIKDKLMNHKLIFYTFNTEITKYSVYNEICGCLFYKIILQTKYKKRIYISLIGINPKISGNGYGSIFLDEFIQKYKRNNQILELVLLSLPESKNFYISLGFTRNSSIYIEKNEEIGDNIILTKIIY